VFYAAGTHPMSAAEEPPSPSPNWSPLPPSEDSSASAKPGSTTTTPPTAPRIQQTSLRIHIEAAQETGLPLIIHARDADEDMERS
jgi:TatD DNase family protein